jgi:hypothetical protein
MEAAESSGINVRLWDFLFYMSFGFVITSSVSIAGVFLVFSYLVIPSVGAMLLSDKLSTRLAIGWIAGSIISFIGVKISYNTGLPTSPVIVVVLAAALIISGIFRYFKHALKKFIALRNLAGATVVILLFITGVVFFRKGQEDPLEHALHMLTSPLSTDRTVALLDLKAHAERKSVWLEQALQKLKDEDAEVRRSAIELFYSLKEKSALAQILILLEDKSDEVRKTASKAIEVLGDLEASKRLIDLATKEDDPELRLQFLSSAIQLGNVDAIPALAQMMNDGGIFAEDAYNILKQHVQLDFKEGEGDKVRHWSQQNSDKLQWDEMAKKFSTK